MYDLKIKEMPEVNQPYYFDLVERWATEIADGGEVRDINDLG